MIHSDTCFICRLVSDTFSFHFQVYLITELRQTNYTMLYQKEIISYMNKYYLHKFGNLAELSCLQNSFFLQ
jgi:hypothetical protein